ncbi:TBC1 domain family member 16 isoform X1 [Aquila chrysaetos chrysaetos]|uniref:TBC1 domain family member 16 n=1 Tax=Aquila chrysaetos chrysaetos TaxID=223781 RepID=A0A663EHE8_AQUCH|nr:TBC1 domain family member 16 isoform X1 [Aquila chrysaetos chrysaetos]XP_029869769.1 TBC1 domain family member 16 isoform X1 [Aquila chrysaetos chrysaetos]XP_029869770.1 TBC1 domain family member 16 isoform X1 [Aquila chrysaetos chrysaetos]XP_029869771.1 TBC1 domain family member 16 isoform X1 [Aquila chrysaetos chrysaetos]XP_029869772.1 TBC1 domain family member 16 isoform X1 [Aquila chrysaetos chrysaetos]XP_040979393.1 TBC1 domain family member 16 isoform X1 [Aquila chrysaetos chrysaetos]
MSLGRLLRRASSKASDLLTLNPGGGSSSSSTLDGEIIYSKNNVCVHPPELLQGIGEHHPGYLCLYMEKDELLGTTLILAWVPNSRIQRQDEEALRYITPESSPVRKAPRKRGRHTQGFGIVQQASPTEQRGAVILKEDILTVSQLVKDVAYISSPSSEGEKLSQCCPTADGTHRSPQPARSDSGILSTISSQEEQNRSELSVEGTEEGLDCRPEPGEDEGSLELSADDVSRDSTFDSDSDAFSSPFCLSPISEALGKSSSSVFLDNESRDTCDNRMTCSTSSASSLDTSAQFQENNGQTQSTRWDEQQKVFALEQVCGVFRVDLGQMRSLRLFFSDEACTCGQLVVASRESQYKIFHFHHGGLDKLSEVFQQWKYCTETHLKDQQLTDEKTCMQFSIRRPKLPSSETHPEENTYKRLDVSAWLHHLNESGQVEEEYKLQKAIFFGGIDISIRGEVWPFLLHYYSYESTSEEREALRLQKRKEYFEIQEKRLSMTPDEQKEFWCKVQFTVDKDVVRTDRSNQFFRGEDNPNVETMRRILLNYAVFNPTIGYSQGMSDLVAPLLAEVLDESDTFWCFVGLMQNTIFISSPRDEDMEKQLMYLRELLRLMHPRFYQHLTSLGEDGLQMLFCHRWILLCFKREFPDAEALRMWEACWAHYQTDYFHLFICVAIVVIYGDDVIEQQLATDQMLLHFSNLAMHMNGELVLRKARSLLYQFHLLPRIPCSLHDLCKLCGTGMWDSGFIPAVECSGHHPESESCPYGGLAEVSSPKPGSEGKRGLKTRDVFAFRK